jgi:hypothetical protein
LAIWVDDILLLCPDESAVSIVHDELQKHFQLTDLGPVTFLLGMNIIRHEKQIYLNQHFYLKRLLESTGMADCNSASTPLPANFRSHPDFTENTQLLDLKLYPYRQILGSLMYAMVATRPDLAFAVTVLSKTMQAPRWCDWLKLKHVLRYIKGTIHYSLCFDGDLSSSAAALHGYSDADWASDPDTRRSFAGFIFILAGGAISWKTKHHPTAATSTAEAETISLAYATAEALWIRNLFLELRISEPFAVPIFCDNRAAITFTEDPICDGKIKHIDIKFQFVRDYVQLGKVKISHVPTSGMLADIFTKATSKDVHLRCIFAFQLRPYSLDNFQSIPSAAPIASSVKAFQLQSNDFIKDIPLLDELRSDLEDLWEELHVFCNI